MTGFFGPEIAILSELCIFSFCTHHERSEIWQVDKSYLARASQTNMDKSAAALSLPPTLQYA